MERRRKEVVLVARAKRQRTKYPGIYKRVTNRGTVYDVSFRVPGERDPRWLTSKFTNLDAAYRYRIRLLDEANGGLLAEAKPKTFETFFNEDWQPRLEARVEQGTLQASSQKNVLRDVKGHLLPQFRTVRVDQIGVEQVERFQDTLSAKGLSNYTVRRIINTLGSGLDLARRRKLIRQNPVADVEKPAATRKRQPMILTREQVITLGDAAERADERNFVLVAAFAGLRASELFGLRWLNVDLAEDAETLIVAEQAYQGELKARTKTASGHRQIVLTPEAAEALRSQQIEGRSSDLGLVFPSPNGKAWRASNFNRRRWQPLRKTAGFPELRLHDLRHFYVSYIRATGLPSAITEQLVGHSDSKTHRGYTHAIPGTEAVIRAAYKAASEEATEE
jgi:integrase